MGVWAYWGSGLTVKQENRILLFFFSRTLFVYKKKTYLVCHPSHSQCPHESSQATTLVSSSDLACDFVFILLLISSVSCFHQMPTPELCWDFTTPAQQVQPHCHVPEYVCCFLCRCINCRCIPAQTPKKKKNLHHIYPTWRIK